MCPPSLVSCRPYCVLVRLVRSVGVKDRTVFCDRCGETALCHLGPMANAMHAGVLAMSPATTLLLVVLPPSHAFRD